MYISRLRDWFKLHDKLQKVRGSQKSFENEPIDENKIGQLPHRAISPISSMLDSSFSLKFQSAQIESNGSSPAALDSCKSQRRRRKQTVSINLVTSDNRFARAENENEGKKKKKKRNIKSTNNVTKLSPTVCWFFLLFFYFLFFLFVFFSCYCSDWSLVFIG